MYAAAVADMEVDRKTGVIKVPRVVMAADVGLVVNPDGVKNQLEGGIVQAISLTMKEQVSFDRREITSRDWSGYPILAFPEVPSIEVLMERSDPEGIFPNHPPKVPLGRLASSDRHCLRGGVSYCAERATRIGRPS
jgi:CO/xanthine dehydrogenase Mo-binding subunit